MKNIYFFLLLFAINGYAQKSTVSGYISDAATGERLIGVNIIENQTYFGTVSNAFGFYSLTLPSADSVTLAISYLGYETQNVRITLRKNNTQNINLATKSLDLELVTVTPETSTPQMSTEILSLETLERLPMLMGETDILKMVQLLPGVQSGSEGSSGFHVRGGSPDQNLILLDGVPVYNASHLFGFFSVFNSDAIKKVKLVKGGFPARYGGRLSSVLDITMNEGNSQEWKGKGNVGLLSSKIMIEGPLQKGKTSMLFTARTTYYDWLLRPVIQLIGDTQIPSYGFYDITGKINHKISEKDKIYFSVYTGRDRFFSKNNSSSSENGNKITQTNLFEIGWGNITSALRWNRLINEKTFSNVSLIYSQYQFGMGTENQTITKFSDGTNETETDAITYNSLIKDWGVNWNIDYYLSPKHSLKSGFTNTYHRFTPKALQLKQPLNLVQDTTFANTTIQAISSSLFVEDKIQFTPKLKANIGVHFANFYVRNTLYPSIQPRLMLEYTAEKDWRYSISLASMQQPIHLLSNTGAGLPTDLWVSSTENIKPQKAWQVAAGIFKQWKNIGWSASIEAYYKDMNNVIEYAEGIDFLEDGPETNLLQVGTQSWEDKVEVGQGEAYGAEFSLRKETGKITGWLAYTHSYSNRLFENLNNGNPFPYKYDRRHDLSIVATYEFSKKFDMGFNWIFSSGHAITLPLESYRVNPTSANPFTGALQFNGNVINHGVVNGYMERNGFKMPNYHRLDLSFNFYKQKKRGERIWSISIYNAYNRLNPYFIQLNSGAQNSFSQTSIFPILPSFSYKFNFSIAKK